MLLVLQKMMIRQFLAISEDLRVLQIRRGNRDNLGIISHISP